MEKTKKSPRFWLALTLASFVGQVAWVVENMYFNVFIYKMFRASAADISLMVAASAVAATVTTLLIGALSDKLGKRRIFISAGYILWGISILSFALIRTDIIEKFIPATASAASVGVSLVIIMDCVMTFFGSSANDACFNAWLTDSTDATNRGAAEGVNAMMPLIAVLAVFGGFMPFDLDRPSSWVAIYIIIGAVVIVAGIFGFFLIRDSDVRPAGDGKYFSNIFYGFRPSVVRREPVLYITLAAFAVFGISIQIFMPYLILYYSVSLGMDNYVLIMAPAIIIAAAATVFAGKCYDRFGFARTVLPALAVLAAGYTVLFFFRSPVPVFIGSLLMMSGYLSGAAIFGAMLRDHTPPRRAGMFQGLRIVGQVLIPGILGPAVGAAVLKGADKVIGNDGTASFIPNRNIFLAALIAAVLILPVLFGVFALKKKTEDVKNAENR